jgi:protein-tyrosine-phosphatase
VLIVCTGNAARSVMAGLMLEDRAQAAGVPLHLTTAGTHALAGQPASWRTREALAQVAVMEQHMAVSHHRSAQLEAGHLEQADLVVGMETDHVRYIRRIHPKAAWRTATLRRLSRDLPPGPGSLAERVRGLGLEAVELEPSEDVADPAGGELETYVACARELWELTGALWARLC